MNIGTFLLVKNTLSDIKLCHMKGGVFAPIKRCSWWIIDQAPMTAKTSAGVSTLFSHFKKKYIILLHLIVCVINERVAFILLIKTLLPI